MKSSMTELEYAAYEVHRERGHPKGYHGPCWGPLPEEVEEAKRRLAPRVADPDRTNEGEQQ